MIEFVGLPDNPARFLAIAVFTGFALVAAAKIYGLIFMRWKTPFRVGEEMNGQHAEVVEWDGETGYVSAGGELWRAAAKEALQPGDAVSIIAVNGLTLSVARKS